MNSIDVSLTPDHLGLYNPENKVVIVVDILRATSCITTGIAHGVKSITPFASLEKCVAMKEKGFIIAGERGGRKVEGFDIGNSPFSYMESHLHDQEIALTTTNGTIAIEMAKTADEIIIGSFLNISAVCDYVKNLQKDIVINCAGWKSRPNLEDTLFAGAIIEKLEPTFEISDDSALMASALYRHAKKDLSEIIRNSSHARRLQKFDVKKDIEFCLTFDEYDVVPVLKGGKIIRII